MASKDNKPARVAKVAVAPIELIQQRIILLRGHEVMLDSDLAEMYGVPTGRLVEAVKRNIERFPDDFMFQLDADEFGLLKSQSAIPSDETPAPTQNLKSQSGTSSEWGGRRTAPYAFTEQGVAMLSSVLRSERAVAVNIAIMRAFVQLRHGLAVQADLARKLDQLETKYDHQFGVVFEAIRQLMEPPAKPRRKIGFAPPDDDQPASKQTSGKRRKR